MASANKMPLLRYIRVATGLLLAIVLVCCATLEQPPSRPTLETVTLESRESLLQWHDATHKSYYALKGPVELLVIKPVKIQQSGSASELPDSAGFTWQLRFNKLGRLLHKKRISNDVPFETIYEYRKDGKTLRRVVTNYDGELWRTSDYQYQDDTLAKVEFIDHSSNDRFSIRIYRQKTPLGWFEIQMPVEKIDIPVYDEFHQDGMLVWSSKGGINNGLGALCYIATVDNVISSSVVNRDTPQMKGQGGYRYRYYGNGLLKAVESYSAHGNDLFHTTTYQYDDLQLLVSEQKTVTGGSVFNEAADAAVDYHYHTVDQHGNWLQRTLTYKSGPRQQTITEKRSISYFTDGVAENDG